ncbi:copper-binding protein [Paucibacter sp. AS339]|uniref:copper-binding protein n=1 Tax=Paucibacter hankyongi TaxID=3133434 RepID=UPI0030A68E80
MNTQQKILITLAAAASMACLPQLAYSQDSAAKPASAANMAAAAAQQDWTEAEVRRVDIAGNKLTLKHGEIKNLDMPGMTMVFGIKAGASGEDLIKQVKPGDKLLFRAEMVQGKTVLTALKRP